MWLGIVIFIMLTESVHSLFFYQKNPTLGSILVFQTTYIYVHIINICYVVLM